MNKAMTFPIDAFRFEIRTFLLSLIFFLSATLCLADTAALMSKPQTVSKAVTVVELFTSQGCSSCPKADRVFEKLTQQSGVIALSFHVDYWDYLGWKDNMASANNSKRQRDYAKFRGDNSVFTPQVIINGDVSLVGQNAKAIAQEIQKQSERNRQKVAVKLWEDEKSVFIEIGAAAKLKTSASNGAKPEGTVWLALIKKSEKITIKRGENRGKTLTYHNVVHELSPIGRWMGEKMSIRLPRQQWMARGSDGCVVILQQDGGKGHIRGAAQLTSW